MQAVNLVTVPLQCHTNFHSHRSCMLVHNIESITCKVPSSSIQWLAPITTGPREELSFFLSCCYGIYIPFSPASQVNVLLISMCSKQYIFMRKGSCYHTNKRKPIAWCCAKSSYNKEGENCVPCRWLLNGFVDSTELWHTYSNLILQVSCTCMTTKLPIKPLIEYAYCYCGFM